MTVFNVNECIIRILFWLIVIIIKCACSIKINVVSLNLLHDHENIKTVSAKHSSNKGKNKDTRKDSALFEYSNEELIESLALKLTPREKNEFDVIHIFIKTDGCFTSVQNKITTRFEH